MFPKIVKIYRAKQHLYKPFLRTDMNIHINLWRLIPKIISRYKDCFNEFRYQEPETRLCNKLECHDNLLNNPKTKLLLYHLIRTAGGEMKEDNQSISRG